MTGDQPPVELQELQAELARIQERAVRARRYGVDPDGYIAGPFKRFFDKDVPSLLGLVEDLARRAGAARSPEDRRRLDDVLAESTRLHGELAECRGRVERLTARVADRDHELAQIRSQPNERTGTGQ